MPRNPVSAKAETEPRSVNTGRAAPVEKTISDTTAHVTFSAAQTAVVLISPHDGISQKAIARTPITAPRVLLAYSGAMGRSRTARRAMAGSVAPIAAVAGRSSRNVPKNATVHCHNGFGVGPTIRSSTELHGAIANANTRLQPAMTASQPAYHLTGLAARSIRGPSIHAPTASPPKKAVTTASTAADSWPSHSAD